ncbi:MAG: STAS domain-containing protein [Acidobacteria bacterium]|nr:STAS domain-containing protein [Acidobacteriota bacterium]
MTPLSWFRRRGLCRIESRSLGGWWVLEVRGKFAAGTPEKRFLEEVDSLLRSGARRVVIDLTGSHFADDTVASAAPEAYHKARAAGAEMRFVVLPGKAGGYYHMAGLEMTIPTFPKLEGAIEV